MWDVRCVRDVLQDGHRSIEVLTLAYAPVCPEGESEPSRTWMCMTIRFTELKHIVQSTAKRLQSILCAIIMCHTSCGSITSCTFKVIHEKFHTAMSKTNLFINSQTKTVTQ